MHPAFALFVAVAVTKTVQARRKRPVTGQEQLVGELGVVRKTLDPDGLVFVHGELWHGHSDEPIQSGQTVLVDAIEDGLVLHVRPAEAAAVATA